MGRNVFITIVKTVIAGGQSVSAAVDCGEGGCLCALQLPAGFEGTALTLSVSPDGITYTPLRDDSGAYQPAAAENTAISLDLGIMHPWRYVKVSGGTAQSAERTITAVVLAE